METEDHDLLEIRHLTLANNLKTSNVSGAVTTVADQNRPIVLSKIQPKPC